MVNMKYIDLHTHTTFSDGLFTPMDLLDKAKEYNLSVISITDHDTLGAYDKSVFDYAESLNIQLVPGIELSTQDSSGHKYHILGLLIDLENTHINNLIKDLKSKRISYAEKVCSLLKNDGWSVDSNKLIKNSKEIITKAHISRSILLDVHNHKKLINIFGIIPSEGKFTEKFLIKGGEYYISNPDKLDVKKAIDIIHQAGGLAILAHPAFNVMQGEDLVEMCDNFKDIGIDGFEAINIQFNKSKHDERVDLVDSFSNYAKKNGLAITGGSDFHHQSRDLMGNFIDLGFNGDKYKVDELILKNLKNLCKNKLH